MVKLFPFFRASLYIEFPLSAIGIEQCFNFIKIKFRTEIPLVVDLSKNTAPFSSLANICFYFADSKKKP